VDGVGQECHRAADEEDGQLQKCRTEQDEKADLECPHPCGAGLEGIVDGIGRIVTMRNEQPVEEALETGRMRMTAVLMPVLVLVLGMNGGMLGHSEVSFRS
jgi:hypothetical protein